MADPEGFPNYDPKEQVDAITGLLASLWKWRAEIGKKAVATVDPATGYGDPDILMQTVYVDAAYCHAAIGAIAPMLEGMFIHEFAALRALWKRSPGQHHRWNLAPEDFWNPSVMADAGKKKDAPNIQAGSIQLLKALEIKERFPNDFPAVTDALFTYRNHALHMGYEWPKERIERFKERVTNSKWERWFHFAMYGNLPWVAFATDTFVAECLNSIVMAMRVFDEVREEHMPPSGSKYRYHDFIQYPRIPPELG